jgi:hypothetical protein
MTFPDAYGSNNVTDDVTPRVDADNPINVHSFLLISISRFKFWDVTSDVVVVVDDDSSLLLSF